MTSPKIQLATACSGIEMPFCVFEDKAQAASSTKTVATSITSLNVTLPSEVHLLIFEHIDNPVTSACLGLTCKAFYPIHRSQHGTVPLRSSVSFGVEFVNLGLLLQNWVPSNLAYNYKSGKFVKYTTLARLWIQWERDDKTLKMRSPRNIRSYSK